MILFQNLTQHSKKYSDFIESLKNKYGLVHSSNLFFKKTGYDYSLFLKKYPDINVFPHHSITSIVKILIENQFPWDNSSIDVKFRQHIVVRAPVFGVPLDKAIDKVMKQGLLKSLFSFNNELKDGFSANLLLFLSLNKKESPVQRELQVWEEIQNTNEVFYSHLIFLADTYVVEHLDCATMYLDEEQKYFLFKNAKKIKTDSYKKHFQIDQKFHLNTAIEILRAYFPIEELSNEAFNMKEI